jgi:CheY-like chemotaxis protein
VASSLVNQALEQISDEERRAGESQCFVGHHFGQKDLRVKLERALNKLGLKPYFADKEVTGEFILTKVCKKILITRASIVDLTKANPNVYFELGLAVGLNKPVFPVLRSGESLPSLLESFVKISFMNYTALEAQVVAEVPGWLKESIEQHILLNNHCHFLNTLCPDRHRISPRRRFLLLDEAESAGAGSVPVHTADPDFRAEVGDAMDRFQFTPVFMDEVPVGISFRLCDYCRALRDSNFVLCHINERTSNNVYFLLGLLTGLGVPGLLMIKEERDRKGNPLWEIPSMLRGLDAFYYTHAVDIGERLGDEVQGFLNRHAGAPSLDKILFFPEELHARPEELFERKDFAASGLLVLEEATEETKRRGQNQITVEHILSAFARHEGELFDAALSLAGAAPGAIRALNEERLRAIPQRAGEELATATATKALFKSAMERARSEGRQTIEAVDLFLALVHNKDGLLAALLREAGVEPEAFAEAMARAARENEDDPAAGMKVGGVDLGSYGDRFDKTGQRVLMYAAEESHRLDQNFIKVEHIMHGFASQEANLFGNLMHRLSLDPDIVKGLIKAMVEEAHYAGKVEKGIRILPETIELFKSSMERARAFGRKRISAADILMMLLTKDREAPFVALLVSLGADPEDLIEQVRTVANPEGKAEQPARTGINLDTYKDRFTEGGGRILESSLEWGDQGNSHMTVGHIMNGVAAEEADLFDAVMRDLSLDPQAVRNAVRSRMNTAQKTPETQNRIRIIPETIDLFKKAMERARSYGRKIIGPPDLIAAAAKYENLFSEILKSLGADPEVIAERVPRMVLEQEKRAELEAEKRARAERERLLANRKGSRILVVDKDWKGAGLLREGFEKEGFDVDAVSSTPAALLSFARNQHHMVIAEYGSEGVGGMEILRYVKNRRPDSQVILMSHQLTADMAVEAGRGGAYTVIEKPPHFDQLLMFVDQALKLQ